MIGDAQSSEYTLRAFTLLAVGLPLLWAWQAPPSPAFYSQSVACALWACVILVRPLGARGALQPGNKIAVLPWIVLFVVLAMHALSGLSPSFAVAPGLLNVTLAALLTVAVFFRSSNRQSQTRWLTAALVAILLAALGNALIVAIQAFAPSWPDDALIARHIAGDRFGGNLRQPNQLATVAVWGLIAAAYLLRRWPWLWGLISAPLVVTLFASESRTGVISLLLVAFASALRSRRVRAWGGRGWLLLIVALIPVALLSVAVFTRSTADSSMAQRVALWRDVVTLIEHNPWFGVGWGQLNFAWTLTPFAGRAPDVFDHAHSLPLQLAVELGVPVTAVVLGLVAHGIWHIARALIADPSRETATVAMLLAVILIHSLLEYPLWFSYFLLPSAFLYAWLARMSHSDATGDTNRTRPPQRAAIVAAASAAALCFASTLFAASEYQKATAIYHNAQNRPALTRAVTTARESTLYGHFGDYAAIMLAGDGATLSMFDRPTRHVLDERLLTAWARALARNGETERAAFVVARAKEFPPNALFNDLPKEDFAAPRSASAVTLTPSDFRRR